MNVDWQDPATVVLTLLLCGHVFADFLFQTRTRAEAKRRSIDALKIGLEHRSIARFKRLDDQRFAEIYLVGTMTSILVAMAGGMALGALIPA